MTRSARNHSSWWLLTDTIVPVALMALWSPPIFAIYQLSRGNILLGSITLLIWLPLFAWGVSVCHRRQLVRLWLALASTGVVLLVFAAMILRVA
ncbi:MAG: membrane protein of unknown function [Nitrospira sp.]|nr:MAG: membrane protein of unknown function [Nitrospira sp.]